MAAIRVTGILRPRPCRRLSADGVHCPIVLTVCKRSGGAILAPIGGRLGPANPPDRGKSFRFSDKAPPGAGRSPAIGCFFSAHFTPRRGVSKLCDVGPGLCFPWDFDAFGPFLGYLGGSIVCKPACGGVVLPRCHLEASGPVDRSPTVPASRCRAA